MKGDVVKKSPSKAGEGDKNSLYNNSSFILKGEHKERLKLADRSWRESERVVDRWLIHEIIPSKGAGMLHGLSGSYKTYVALDIACHIATGTAYHGFKTQQGGVLFIEGEGDGLGIKQRINAWLDFHLDASPSSLLDNIEFLNFEFISQLKFRKNNEVLCWLTEGIKAEGSNIKLIVVDTQSVFNVGDENKEETAKDFVETCKYVSVELGCNVLFIHHDGKNSEVSSGQTYRGSSAFYANSDYSLKLKVKPGMINHAYLEIEKMRQSKSNYSFEVGLSEITFEEGYGSSLAVTSLTCCENVDLSRNNDKRIVFEDFLKYCSLNKGDTFGYEDFKSWRESKGDDDESIRRAFNDKNRFIDRWLEQSYIARVDSGFQGTKRKFNVV